MSNAQVVHRKREPIDEDLLSEDCTGELDCYCQQCALEQTDTLIMFSNPDNSMDRFVPCRTKENLYDKFEAAA